MSDKVKQTPEQQIEAVLNLVERKLNQLEPRHQKIASSEETRIPVAPPLKQPKRPNQEVNKPSSDRRATNKKSLDHLNIYLLIIWLLLVAGVAGLFFQLFVIG